MTTAGAARVPVDKVNVLLVDDQPSRLLSYQAILGSLGLNLISARSGIEALDHLMKHDVAAVLLDVSMPEMDGFETAAMIHSHPRFEQTPIIFVTGVHDTDLDRLKGYELGAVDYVSIPVTPEILRSKVAVLVELDCQRRELQALNRSLADANAQLERAHTTLQAEKNRELEVLNEHLRIANLELAEANRALKAENVERLRAELALKDADRRKDEFLAILAHELRNPLAPIRYAVEIMSRVALAEPSLLWSREVIGRQILHLTQLVDDLLDISRITRGVINLSREPLHVRTIVRRAVEAVQPAIIEHRHRFTVDCDDADSMMVEGDLTRLVQVLGNLLSNAAKYTPPGGNISLSARPSGGAVEFRVKDDGAGIPPEAVPKLFNLFTRLPSNADGAQSGLGIGLALVRQLVEMHGGEVSVHSDGASRGSEFIVRLPVLNTGTAAVGVERSDEPGADPAHRRVLIVDDNIDALQGLALLLELAGHEVLTASDGQAAIELAASRRPDLVLLDLGMPVMNGYEVARRIRSEPWGTRMPLVALSGWGQTEDLRRTREAGFDHHLVKPVSYEAVSEALTSLAALPATASVPVEGSVGFTDAGVAKR